MRSFPSALAATILALSLLGAMGCRVRTVETGAQPAKESAQVVDVEKKDYRLEIRPVDVEILASFAPFEGDQLSEILTSTNGKEETEAFFYQDRSTTLAGGAFQGLLPQDKVALGQVWEIEPAAVERFLSVLHPNIRADMNMDGSGAVGALSAVSDKFFEISFRMHAQFLFGEFVWVTPAQFDGRLVVERESQAVRRMELKAPTEHYRNVAFEVYGNDLRTGLGYTPNLGFESGKPVQVEWSDSISREAIHHVFSEHLLPVTKIDWLPLDEALAQAEREDKPILAIVLEGALTDQSC